MAWIKSSSGKVLTSSVALLLYTIFIVVPFADKYNFFNENTSPQADKILIYFLFTTPVFIVYIVYVIFHFRRTVFLTSISYPVIVFNLHSGFYACILVQGGAVLWYMLVSIPILIIAILISFGIGIARDVNYYMKYKQSKNQLL